MIDMAVPLNELIKSKYPRNHQKIFGFLMISGGSEMYHSQSMSCYSNPVN